MRSTTGDLATAIEAMLRLPEQIAALAKEVSAIRAELAVLRRMVPPMLVSVPEAARRLGVTPRTIRRYVARRYLRSVQVGESVKVDLSSVAEALGRDAEAKS